MNRMHHFLRNRFHSLCIYIIRRLPEETDYHLQVAGWPSQSTAVVEANVSNSQRPHRSDALGSFPCATYLHSHSLLRPAHLLIHKLWFSICHISCTHSYCDRIGINVFFICHSFFVVGTFIVTIVIKYRELNLEININQNPATRLQITSREMVCVWGCMADFASMCWSDFNDCGRAIFKAPGFPLFDTKTPDHLPMVRQVCQPPTMRV